VPDFGGKLSFPECGKKGARQIVYDRRRREAGFIYGGRPVENNQHPWQAAFLGGGEVFCGGTLVSRTAVVTGDKAIFSRVG